MNVLRYFIKNKEYVNEYSNNYYPKSNINMIKKELLNWGIISNCDCAKCLLNFTKMVIKDKNISINMPYKELCTYLYQYCYKNKSPMHVNKLFKILFMYANFSKSEYLNIQYLNNSVRNTQTNYIILKEIIKLCRR